MAVTVETSVGRGLELSVSEVTGALGDSVTVLPVVVAVGTLTRASLPHLLLGFAVFQVVWGVRYGLPVSVEPMKALAGLAIAGALTYGEVAAAGLLAGGVLLVGGRLGLLGALSDRVGEPVVRGVQFAVALLLLRSGVDLAAGAPAVALGGVAVAVVAAAVDRRLVALAVLGAGVVAAAVAGGLPSAAVPSLALFPTGLPSPTRGALSGSVGQLAMTVGNAAVATSLLLTDLFDAEVTPDDLAESMGVMNLLAIPTGAFPMCHGSGGLAGKYAFGARTGGANVVLGVLYAGAALVAGFWTAFPAAVLGVLLAVVALQLGRTALSAGERWLVLGVGVLGLLAGVGVAFVVGAGVHALAGRYRARA
ncbi:MAG: putative sulfate/molybdate transporter [Haloarculaceae archaeon]